MARQKPEATDPGAGECTCQGEVIHQRNTVTGRLSSDVYFVQEGFKLVDGDGQLFDIPDGATILVVNPAWADQAQVERFLDSAELLLHHSYGMRPAREKTATLADIRKNGRKVATSDDIPF